MLNALLVYPNIYSSIIGMSDSTFKLLTLVNFSVFLTICLTKSLAWLFFDGFNSIDHNTISQRSLFMLTGVIQSWSATQIYLTWCPHAFLICSLFLCSLMALHWVCFIRVRNLQTSDVYDLTWRKKFRLAKLGVMSFAFLTIDLGIAYYTIKNASKISFSFLLIPDVLIELIEKALGMTGEYIVNIAGLIYLMRNEDEDDWDLAPLLLSCVRLVPALFGFGAYAALIVRAGWGVVYVWSLIMYMLSVYRIGHEIKKAYTAESEVDKFTVVPEEADLERDNTCVICREDMILDPSISRKKVPKKLNCGHVMHSGCLQSWLARSDKCPTCRQTVNEAASTFGQPQNAHNIAHQEDEQVQVQVQVQVIEEAVPAQEEGLADTPADGEPAINNIAELINPANMRDGQSNEFLAEIENARRVFNTQPDRVNEVVVAEMQANGEDTSPENVQAKIDHLRASFAFFCGETGQDAEILDATGKEAAESTEIKVPYTYNQATNQRLLSNEYEFEFV